jgi:hypothetical protein
MYILSKASEVKTYGNHLLTHIWHYDTKYNFYFIVWDNSNPN